MAYILRAKIDFGWVPDGAGGSMAGQQQADFPGFGATGQVGTVFVAQEASINVGEWVIGGDAPTDGNFQTALTALGTDAGTIITTAGSVPGFTSGKLTDLMRAWATGGT